jgi:phenylacetate-CoA ligase
MSATKTVVHPGFRAESALDYMAPHALRELQLKRMRDIVRRAYDHVGLFRQRMDERRMKPEDVRSLDDVARLPFTTKMDLRDTYPFGLFASPMKEVVRLHASSGTTGKPIVVSYTKADLESWTSVMARALATPGLHEGDIVQNCFGYGLFTGGLGYHYGAERLGASVIPISGGNTERQIMIMKDFGSTVVFSTPSYFLHVIERAEQMGVDLRQLPLRMGFFGAEPWSDQMRRHIEKSTGIKAYDLYGLSEIFGPGVSVECECQDGLHIFEDHFYAEIIDPDTLEVLPEGAEGELVLTTLTKMAMPMIRYRTRDITRFLPGQCACGRTIRRHRRIGRRSDDMLIIRGVNVFPSQIESVLLECDGTLPHYQIVLTRERGLDQLEIQVEVTAKVFSDKVGTLEALQKKLADAIEHVLGVRVQLTLVEPSTIQRSEGKAKRVIDRRTS